MKSQKISSKKQSQKKSVAFQSDIVIDIDGNIFISFLGEDLLHLVDNDSYRKTKRSLKIWPQAQKVFSQKVDIKHHEYESCKICPRSCGFNRLEKSHSLCGDYKLRVSNYGISFGDEKILSQNGGSGVIFLSGCPLTCPSCINKEKVHSQGKETSGNEFIELVNRLRKKQVSNIQILSPTVHFPALVQILKVLKKSHFPIPIALKTSGHDLPEQIKRFEGLVDIYIPDLKPCFNLEWAKKSKIQNNYSDLFIKAFEEMYKQVGNPRFNSDGSLIGGVIIRYVRPPFMSANQNHKIMTFLENFKDKAHISVLDNYVTLE